MKKLGIFALSVLVALLVSTGSVTAKDPADALDAAVKRGKLIVTTELAAPPWNYKDPNSGEAVGFVIDLMKMYTESIGISLEVNNVDWPGVVPSLVSKKADMLPWISRTMPRSTKFMFSESYKDIPAQLLVRKGEFKSIDELNKGEKIITATSGSVWVEVAEKNFPKAQVHTVGSNTDNIIALNTKRADAHLNDETQLIGFMSQYPDNFEILPQPVSMDSLGCAVRFDSPKLLHSINLFLNRIKIDGTYAKLHKKWLGYDPKPASD
jgi:ABC-type amino acid transport substrate-binding protein